VAVRDRNWGTVAPALSHVRMQVEPDSFHISYQVENRQDDSDFVWQGTITGERDGTIRFEMEGEARSTFLRNRIGFCVLHPVCECAGQPCEVRKTDGKVERGVFPRYISPQQPFQEMRAIAHEVATGVRAEVRFEGDIFEMEDQRNWTDASYKTYCTPLAVPYPVEVRKGERISQSVTLTLKGSSAAQAAATPEELGLTVWFPPTPPHPLPRIGLGVASHGEALSEQELTRLRALNLAHLRVDLRLSDSGYSQGLRRAAREARALGVTLEVALFLSDDAEREMRSLMELLQTVRPSVVRWLVFRDGEPSTGERWVRVARRHLTGYDARATIGTGSNAYFTELNRSRPPVEAADLVCFSVNPQVHAFDNASLVETLEAQAGTVESARQFAAGRPLAVTPVTLRPRFNPNATGPEREPGPDELPSPVDARQMSLFGAGWTLGSVKYLAQSEAASVTYYETTGWRGVMETEAGPPRPELFRSEPGAVFPLYHVLADVGEFAGGVCLTSTSSDPLQVECLALRDGERGCLLLASYSSEPHEVTIRGVTGTGRVRRLDETTVRGADRSPEAFRTGAGERVEARDGNLTVRLLPFALARIDLDAGFERSERGGE
jgi:D-apionolactonase